MGDGLPAPRLLRPRRPRGGRGAARAALGGHRQAAHPDARSTSRSRTGCRSSCSRCSPTATASTSCSRWPRAASIRSSRTTRFMLTEEAHHMFVGETGVGRVVKRACELMKQDPNEDVRAQGGIDLDDGPEVRQLLVLLEPRPVRRRDLVERGRLLRVRAEGPRARGAVRRPRGAARAPTAIAGHRGRAHRRARTCRCATR